MTVFLLKQEDRHQFRQFMQYKIEGQHDSYPEGNPGKEDLSHWHYGADDETQPTLGEHDAEPGQEGLEVGSETQVQ